MTVNVQRAGHRLVVSGDMTVERARALLESGIRSLESGGTEFDLTGVREVDSAGLAILFGWQRAARAQGKTIRITHAPQNLCSLAGVYDVTELLPLA